MQFSGVFAALPTPFDYRGAIYQAKVLQNIGRWNRTGLAGYLVTGRAGEGALLNGEEKRSVWEWVAQEAKSGATLLAGSGTQSVRETIKLTKQAARIGYHAAVISPPLRVGWGAEPADTVSFYYRSVADQGALPIVIDNPLEGGFRQLSVETIATLAEHPNIVAVVDECAESQVNLLECLPESFSVLVGDSPNPASWLDAGSSGMINGFAAIEPFFCLNLCEAARTREHDAVRDLEQRVQKVACLLLYRHGIAGLKYALDLNGYYGGPARLPLSPLRPRAKREIARTLYGIDRQN